MFISKIKTLVKFPLKNYQIAKVYFNLVLDYILQKSTPLIVYQMGKVGSTTVTDSLRNNPNLSHPIFHVHSLNPENILKDKKIYYGEEYPSYFAKSYLPKTKHLFTSEFLQKKIETGYLNSSNRWKIITLVRDPIARNVSGFFSGMSVRYPDYYKQVGDNKIEVEKVLELFLANYPQDTPFTWFDSELKLVFGVDVFSEEFPKSKGYKIYHKDLVDVLVLKLEDIDRIFEEAIKDFLNIDRITFVHSNEAKRKSYYLYYRSFIKEINFSKSYLDKMYNNQYSQHFYTEEEISNFRKKWSKESNSIQVEYKKKVI